MRWTDLATVLVVAAWGYLFVAGIEGLQGIRDQHVSGYPADGQIILYAGFPALFLAVLATAVVLSRKARRFNHAYPAAVGVCGFALLPVLMVWGGGV